MHNKINNQYVNNVQYCCRVPQGTCGLKYMSFLSFYKNVGRVPQGTCGLKCQSSYCRPSFVTSGPARDLWIEINDTVYIFPSVTVGSRKGPVD